MSEILSLLQLIILVLIYIKLVTKEEIEIKQTKIPIVKKDDIIYYHSEEPLTDEEEAQLERERIQNEFEENLRGE